MEDHLTVGFQMYNRDGKWSINSHQLEAVLGLWLWSLKRSEILTGHTTEEQLIRSKMVVVENSTKDDIKSALFLWVTQTRQVREHEAKCGVSRSDNLTIPTSILLSGDQSNPSSNRNCGALNQTDTPNADRFTILAIPTDGSTSLLQLMAQDIYTIFINRIVDVVGDLRGTVDPEEYFTLREHSLSTASRATPSLEFANPHIDALANTLISAGVATREEALMSIIPPFLYQKKLPLLDDDVVQSLLEWAKSLRRDSRFREGAGVLTWVLSKCPDRFQKQALRCLGDLYRRSVRSKRRADQEFGLSGMRNMKTRRGALAGALASDPQMEDILGCYENLYHFFHDRKMSKTEYLPSVISRDVDLGSRNHRRHSGERGSEATIGQKDLELALTLCERFYLPSGQESEDQNKLFDLLTWALSMNFPEMVEDLWTSAISLKENKGKSPLRVALDHKCQLETFHSLLDWPGIDIDAQGSESGLVDDSKTPLICAVEAHRTDVACSILRRGANLHQHDGQGMTPLQHSYRCGNKLTIQFLLERGADVDERAEGNRAALHLAAEANSEAVIKWLIEEGADIHEKAGENRTALLIASKANNETVIRLLLENGAEISEKDERGRAPLHYAAEGNSSAVMRLLLEKGGKLEEKDGRGRTPLHTAAMVANPSVVQFLLEQGANIDEKDEWDQTALHLASAKGRGQVVRLLLEKGADIDAKDDEGQTPLHRATYHGHEQVVWFLIEKGADIHTKDEYDQTLLHLASRGGHVQYLRFLLEKGADIDAKDENGQTPLHITARRHQDSVIRLLVERGANVHEKDNSGQTVLHFVAVGHCREETIRFLLEKGANVHEKDENGQTALHLAPAGQGYRDIIIRLLLENGANVHEKDKSGQTVLHITAGGWDAECFFPLLLEKGANVHEKDENGQTALHLVAANRQRRVKDAAQVLLEQGADLREEDGEGRTALHVAAQHNKEDMLRLLLEKSVANGWTDHHDGSLWAYIARDNEAMVELLQANGIKKPMESGKKGLEDEAEPDKDGEDEDEGEIEEKSEEEVERRAKSERS
jgi:ankyrin repeat protein